MTNLPTHPTLRHPRTGDPLCALGVGKRGPIWPVLGGDGTGTPPAGPPAPVNPPPPVPTGTPPAQPPAGAPPATDPPVDVPLGPAGERALAAEREARKALEKELSAYAPLKTLAEALAGRPGAEGKSEVDLLKEQFAAHEKTVADERAARFRAEVAHEKKLTPEQAEWLRGGTREELEANADKLLAAFPGQPAGPRTPAPDPSQGGRGAPPLNADALIAEAQGKGDWKTVMRLQNQKLGTTH